MEENIKNFEELVDELKNVSDKNNFDNVATQLTKSSNNLLKQIQQFKWSSTDLYTHQKSINLGLLMTKKVTPILLESYGKIFSSSSSYRSFGHTATRHSVRTSPINSCDEKNKCTQIKNWQQKPDHALFSSLSELDKVIAQIMPAENKESVWKGAQQFDEMINQDISNVISEFKPLYLDHWKITQSELEKSIKKFDKLVDQFKSKDIIRPSFLEHKAPELIALTKKLNDQIKSFYFMSGDEYTTQTHKKLDELMKNKVLPTLTETYNKVFESNVRTISWQNQQHNMTVKIDDSKTNSRKLINEISELDSTIVEMLNNLPYKLNTSENEKKSAQKNIKVVQTAFNVGDEIIELLRSLWRKHQANKFDKTVSEIYHQHIEPELPGIISESLNIGDGFVQGITKTVDTFSVWLRKKMEDSDKRINQKKLDNLIKDLFKDGELNDLYVNCSPRTSTTYSFEFYSTVPTHRITTEISQLTGISGTSSILELPSQENVTVLPVVSFNSRDVYYTEDTLSSFEIGHSSSNSMVEYVPTVEEKILEHVESMDNNISNIDDSISSDVSIDHTIKTQILDLNEAIRKYISTHFPGSQGYVWNSVQRLNIPKRISDENYKKLKTLDNLIAERNKLIKQLDPRIKSGEIMLKEQNYETKVPVQKNKSSKKSTSKAKYRSDSYYSKINAALLAR